MRKFVALPILMMLFSIPRPARADSARDMEINGIVLTVIGGAALVTGSGFLIASRSTSTSDADIIYRGTGIGLAAAGAVHLAVGIPLWIVGALKPKRSKVELAPLRLALSF